MRSSKDLIAGLRKVGQILHEEDERLRAKSPKCEHCGRPMDGFVPAGWTKAQAGLCNCPPWKKPGWKKATA